jgi:hypothetical protein
VKVLSASIAAPASRERFRREARLAAGLTHPGILPRYAFGEAGELPYIVMGYARGETLADRLRHERRIPLDRARRILADLASALDYAHRHGVIHRDIKPENIMLEDESDRALLMDFGIAKSHVASGAITATGVAIGTPRYMSPEQALGDRDIDGRSDLYSLGVVAYEMLAGRHPLGAAHETFLRRSTPAVPPLRTLAPDVPEDLAAAIMRCMATEPDERWPDTRSFCLAVTRGSGAEAGVADELREVAGFGSWALLWVAVWGSLAAASFAGGSRSVLLLVMALLVPLGFLLQGWNIHRAGFAARQILRVGMWPPKWWGLWWPRILRRPDDVWHELPKSARVGRVILSLFFVGTPALAYAERVASQQGAASATLLGLRVTTYALVAATGLSIAVLAARWHRRGMGTDQLARLLVGSTTRGAFWRQPQISPLLQVSSDQTRAIGPQTPHDYLRAISADAELLTGSARAVGSDAVAAARTLLSDIDALDTELASLRRDADPVEIARAEHRLSLLGDAGGDGDQQQVRALLRQQLEVLERMKGRAEVATDQRARLLDMLRSLWAAVRDLGTGDAGPATRAERVDSLRSLCSTIQGSAVRSGAASTISTFAARH